ncbi:Stalked cell differentiation-controlling protein [Marinibacterium anthonyi]|nr:GGDEF domain-containing protein [Paracoccaceae bacterium]QEW23002.1 Stalked cell differentiation-controlling protein [Marinibacterium anthonyi]
MNRLNTYLKTLSLRAWIAAGMGIALIPLVLIGVISFLSYHNNIARPFQDELNLRHRILMPTERINDELWKLSSDVNFYVRGGLESYRDRFQIAESRVERHLGDLDAVISQHARFQPILDDVNRQWAQVVSAAAQVAPGQARVEDPELADFEQDIIGFARSLAGVVDGLRVMQEAEHDRMLRVMRRIEWAAATAALISIVMIALSIEVIDRALIRSTDQLVAGAMRVAQGDRDSAIDVRVPPELAAVANAFNAMTQQIVQQEMALSAAARSDGLTGVANRREFDRVMDDMIRQADAGGAAFALVMIDVDHFKAFNDTHGHLAGDDALRQVAAALSGAVRPTDMLFRYGGEEFAVVLGDIGGSDAAETGERLRAAVAGQTVLLPSGLQVDVTVSVGVSVHAPRTTAGDLVRRADAALYRAKRAGRNSVVIAT